MNRLLAAALLAASPALAQDVPPDSAAVPPAVLDAAPDSAATEIDAYLQGLQAQTEQSFRVDAFSMSAAEVDSAIRAWQDRDTSVAYGAPEPRWRTRLEIGAVRYNRVEGMNVMPRATVELPTRFPLEFSAGAGYGWAAREPTWHGGARVEIPWPRRGTSLSASHRRDVYAYGAGGVPGNSVIALASGKDYADYFRGEGWSAAVGVPVGRVRLGAAWQAELQETLANEARFTLFEGKQDFRSNPPIDDGRLRAVELALGWGDASAGSFAGDLRVARAGSGLGGSFEYDRVRAEVVTRRRLWFGDELKARWIGGSVRGEPPFQALHHVGGTRILRGYEINEFATRRFAQVAVDYKIGTDLLGFVPFVRHLRLQPVPFFDAAVVTETPASSEVFWRFSTGAGIQRNLLGLPGGKGEVRLDVARRLDRGDGAMTYRLGFTVER
ncbi:MAG: hypothetical protein ACT4PE_06400 [Candidatus Eiseniibacteriota bacterium]